MTEQEMAVLIAGISKDITYIKERLDDKCKMYDKHLEESPKWHEKITKSEERLGIVWLIFIIVITAVVGAYFKK